MFVLVVTLLVFMAAAVTLAVTINSRRVSARYTYYNGLYDMAVAGNERVLLMIRSELADKEDEIDERVRQRIALSDLTQHLVYRNRQFHLGFPEDGYYAAWYKTCVNEIITEFLTDTFTPIRGEYKLAYGINLALTEPESESVPFAETYQIDTTVTTHGGGYTVITLATKSTNGETAYRTQVEAELEWPTAAPHEEIYLPSYTWRDKPAYFDAGLYLSGVLEAAEEDGTPVAPETWMVLPDADSDMDSLVLQGEPFAAVTDAARLSDLLQYTAASLDVSLLYENGKPTPSFILHSGGPLSLYASDPSKNVFAGLVVNYGDMTLAGVDIRGLVMADGDVLLTAPVALHPEPEMIFRIALPSNERESLYDFLRLSHFADAGAGPETDMAALLGRLAFGPDSAIIINNFDADSPAMVKSKKIAN